MKWRLINSGFLDGYTNMSIDEAMFNLSGTNCNITPTLRLYGWNPPAISIGYFQKVDRVELENMIPSLVKGLRNPPYSPFSKGPEESERFPGLNPGDCFAISKGGRGIKEGAESLKSRYDKIDIVRRLTGGGAILHEQELTFCLVTVLKDSIIPEDVSKSYRMICGAVITGLRTLGIEARIRGSESHMQNQAASTPSSIPPTSPFNKGGRGITEGEGAVGVSSRTEPFFCFARPSRYDIVFEGKKLVGSAQRRKHGVLLHHGSILLDEQDLDGVTSINSILGRQLEFEEVSEDIAQGFEKELSIELTKGELTGEELELSRQLVMTKYRNKVEKLLR